MEEGDLVGRKQCASKCIQSSQAHISGHTCRRSATALGNTGAYLSEGPSQNEEVGVQEFEEFL